MKRLSDLEHTVLGLIRKHGPCTRYFVRSQFQKSPSSHWSGSAGSIYPLMERLEDLGLIRSRDAAQGRRRSRLCAITAKGLRQLVAWLRPPLQPEVVSVHFDAIRTRMFFLEALTPSERQQFLADAETKLRLEVELIKRNVQELHESDDLFESLAARGALQMTRARLAWIIETRRALANKPGA